jgi:uncharacterized protein YceH (UPF0502 family)
VRRLERRPGQKEERFEQLLEDPAEEPGAEDRVQPPAGAEPGSNGEGAWEGASAGAEPIGDPPSPAGLLERVERLEREVAELRAAGEGQRDGRGESLGAGRE